MASAVSVQWCITIVSTHTHIYTVNTDDVTVYFHVCFCSDAPIVTIPFCVLIAPCRTMPSSSSPCLQLLKNRASFLTICPAWSGDCGATAAYRAASHGRESTNSTTLQHSECQFVHFILRCHWGIKYIYKIFLYTAHFCNIQGVFIYVFTILSYFYISHYAICSCVLRPLCLTTINVNVAKWETSHLHLKCALFSHPVHLIVIYIRT